MDIFFTNPIILLVISIVLIVIGLVLYVITKFRLPLPSFIGKMIGIALGLATISFAFYILIIGYNKGCENTKELCEIEGRKYRVTIDSLESIIVEMKVNKIFIK